MPTWNRHPASCQISDGRAIDGSHATARIHPHGFRVSYLFVTALVFGTLVQVTAASDVPSDESPVSVLDHPFVASQHLGLIAEFGEEPAAAAIPLALAADGLTSLEPAPLTNPESTTEPTAVTEPVPATEPAPTITPEPVAEATAATEPVPSVEPASTVEPVPATEPAPVALPVAPAVVASTAFRVEPEAPALIGPFAQVQLLVTAVDAAATARPAGPDLTPVSEYQSSNLAVVRVETGGRLHAVGDGTAEILIRNELGERRSIVTVTGFAEQPVVSFHDQIRPLLNKAGCAAAACHASQFGKGGFKLSVFGFDPQGDYTMLTRDSLGRRANFVRPETSLLLTKPSGAVAHGGGRRFERGSPEYEMLATWIRQGAPAPTAERPLKRLEVTPAHRVTAPGQKQQLRVTAHYQDGSSRDVTAWSKFDSLDEGVIGVDGRGLVIVRGQGQGTIMVRFEGQAEISTFVAPYGPPAQLAGWIPQNFVDEHAANKFRELGIEPSPLCDDTTFLRRIFLDATGTLPTPAEIDEFLSSTDPQKRQLWIDRLLGFADSPSKGVYTERYASLWTIKWADLLRNSSRDIGEQGNWALHNWLKDQFRRNRSWGEITSELIQAKGSTYSNGPANFFLINGSPQDRAESTAQTFLGLRMTCAQCHHHPFEKWGQDDYFAFAAFFARVGVKVTQEFGLFGLERVVIVNSGGEVYQPRTGQLMKPRPLDRDPVEHPLDRRIPLAKWLTSPENTMFSKSVVNRYVAYLLGRGLVEPVDDMRATNPPTNVALLDALAADFSASGYNLKHLIRTIMSSRLYQLSSQPTAENVADHRFYSHFRVKRLTAEPLLDAVDFATGSTTKFPKLPMGTRAIDLPDTENLDQFLRTFAKPPRRTVCECERAPDPNLGQALHLLNGELLTSKLVNGSGRIAKLLAASTPHEAIVTELYLVTLSRRPTAEELSASQQFRDQASSPQEGYEDLLWALINSKYFLCNR